MQPFCVVNAGDEVIDAGAGIGDDFEGSCTQRFAFQHLHEAFRLGAVIGVAGQRHRDNDLTISQALPVCPSPERR